MQITPDGALDNRAINAWTDMQVLALKITPLPKLGKGSLPCEPSRLRPVLLSTLHGFGTLAMKTTIPATQASLTGAGSSTSNND